MLRRLFKSLVLKPQVVDEIDEITRFRIAANATVLIPTGAYSPTYHRSKSVRNYEGRCAVMREIDGHPDVHDYLWDRAGAKIPRECCWVIRAKAAFANPETNIIFATASGTHDVRIRVSDEHFFSFRDYDTDPCRDDSGFRWVRSRLKIDDDRTMLAMAYEDSKIANKKRTIE